MDRPCAYSPMDYVDDAPVFGHFTQRTFSQFNIRGQKIHPLDDGHYLLTAVAENAKSATCHYRVESENYKQEEF